MIFESFYFPIIIIFTKSDIRNKSLVPLSPKWHNLFYFTTLPRTTGSDFIIFNTFWSNTGLAYGPSFKKMCRFCRQFENLDSKYRLKQYRVKRCLSLSCRNINEDHIILLVSLFWYQTEFEELGYSL